MEPGSGTSAAFTVIESIVAPKSTSKILFLPTLNQAKVVPLLTSAVNRWV
jgi:hypothetical protein